MIHNCADNRAAVFTGGVDVLIDLKEYGELWEDFYDCLTAHARADAPRESLAEVREQLRRGAYEHLRNALATQISACAEGESNASHH